MALTTQDSSKLAQNVVTDVNANREVPNSSEAKKISRELAVFLDKSIVARPLMVPEVCSIHVKNTEYAYRWVNKKLYTQRKASGFINATNEDVEVLGGEVVATNGEIACGDLILMKIRQDLYDAALKWNQQKAHTLARTRGMYLQGASSDVNSDSTPQRVSVSQEAFSRTGLAKPFIPENPDAIVDDSISSGRVKAARERVAELRENRK